MWKNGLLAGVASVAILLSTQASAQQITNMLVYGDSLSDAGRAYQLSGGANPPSPPYYMGRFSNGPVWVENLAPLLGFTHNTATNFAVGGAETGTGGSVGVATQLQMSAAAVPNANSLVVLWAGANDYLNNAATTPSTVLIPRTVGNIATAVGTLRARGGVNFLVPNLPDLGRTPGGASTGQGTSLGVLTQAHNAALASAMTNLEAATGARIVVLDVYGLFNDVLANPSAYGMANTAIPCLTPNGPTGACGSAAAANATLFWDPIHPTARAHELLAAYADASLDQELNGAPSAASAAYLAPILLDGVRQGITARVGALRRADAPEGMQIYAGVRYGFGDHKGTMGVGGFDYDVMHYVIGVDQASENFVVGGAFVHANLDGTADLARGTTDVSANGFAAYIGYRQNDVWINLSGGGLWESYDFTRNAGFAVRPTATGGTNGQSLYAALDAGIEMDVYKTFTFGPMLGVRYARTELDDYTEQDAAMFNQAVVYPDDHAIIGSAGLVGSARLTLGGAAVTPYARVVYENAFSRFSHTAVVTTGSGMTNTVRVAERDRDRLLVGAGLAVNVAARLSVSLDYEGTVIRTAGADHGFVGRVSYAF